MLDTVPYASCIILSTHNKHCILICSNRTSSSKGPCLYGGVCTNFLGSFSCACPANRTGFRCQYTDVCLSQTTPCPPGTTCVETTTREGGYICVANITSDSHLAVSTTTLSGAQLEELEYVLLEAQVGYHSIQVGYHSIQIGYHSIQIFGTVLQT